MSRAPGKNDAEKVAAKTTEKKTGAGPAMAAHSKDAASSGKSGQDLKATAKKSGTGHRSSMRRAGDVSA
jgi:hypothetical protein